jgi:type II secretory pathway pseudopilin PulG
MTNYCNRKKHLRAGFTLIEILFFIGISSAVLVVAAFFVNNVLSFRPYLENRLTAEGEAGFAIEEFVSHVRAMSQSNVGDYPIVLAEDDTFTFFTDFDKDGIYERLRYYAENGTLKRATLEPLGNPLVYDPANETVRELVHDLTNTAIFSYYNSSFAGTSSPMTFPVTIADVRMIKMTLSTDVPDEGSDEPFVLSGWATARNLRSNL